MSRDPLAWVQSDALAQLDSLGLTEEVHSAAPVSVVDDGFPEQLGYIRDESRLKVIISTRRGGKSMAWCVEVAEDALANPGSNYLYVGLTMPSADKAIWKEGIKLLDAWFSLGINFNESKHTATFPNGSVLYLLGMDSSKRQKEKARGGKYRKILIDEAQSFDTDLVELVEVLRPTTTDQRGSITLAGTPGFVRRGLFFDLTHDQDPQKPGTWSRDHMATAGRWSGHRWTANENPHMREAWQQELAEMVAINPRIVETPGYMRERLGRWSLDDSKLVYRYNPTRNTFDGKLPEVRANRGRWHHVLSCDLGFTDASAFTVLAYHDHLRTAYVRRSYKKPGLDVTGVAEEAKALNKIYDFDEYVIDGANKQAVQEMVNRHDLPWQAADKAGKADFIDIVVNAELVQGYIKIDPAQCSDLTDELGTLIWDERALKNGKREEHPACPNHATDTLLYGARKIWAYLSKALPPVPKVGTPEWAAAEERKMEDAALAEAARAERGDDE